MIQIAMTDREKVIKEFELFIKEFHPACTSEGVELDMFREVLAVLNEQKELLKEQEPVEPEAEVLNEVDRLYRCPKCHKHFFYRKQKYCDQCGQAVKWK